MIREMIEAGRDYCTERRDSSDARAARHPGTMIGDWSNLEARVFDLFAKILGSDTPEGRP